MAEDTKNSPFKLYKENDAVAIKTEGRPDAAHETARVEERKNSLEEMIGGGLPTGPSKTIVIQKDGNMTLQELTGKIIEGLKTEPQNSQTGEGSDAAKPRSDKIDRDPYMILDFVKKVDVYRDEVLGVCWDMREHLEAARPYMNGSSTYLTLIEQMIGMTSEVQKLLDKLGVCSYNEAKKAKALIEAFERAQNGREG